MDGRNYGYNYNEYESSDEYNSYDAPYNAGDTYDLYDGPYDAGGAYSSNDAYDPYGASDGSRPFDYDRPFDGSQPFDGERPFDGDRPYDGNGAPTGLVPLTQYEGNSKPKTAGEDGDGREFLNLEIRMRKMRNRVRRRYVAMILVSFIFAFTLIFRYSLVIETNESIVRERGVLEEIQNANGLLQKEISQEMDLEKVRLLAEVRLNMQKPDKHQIVYIKVPKKDHAVVSLSGLTADSRLQNPFSYLVEQARLMQEKLFAAETAEADKTAEAGDTMKAGDTAEAGDTVNEEG